MKLVILLALWTCAFGYMAFRRWLENKQLEWEMEDRKKSMEEYMKLRKEVK